MMKIFKSQIKGFLSWIPRRSSEWLCKGFTAGDIDMNGNRLVLL